MAKQNVERTEISSIGEFRLIDRITKGFDTKQPSSLVGIGDDAAVIKISDDQVHLVSTDMLVEGIHFDLSFHPLKHLGYKAVIVNLSDICAMNAIPKQITFSMAISNRFSVEAVEELYQGVQLACEHYGVDLIGGDTTSSLKGLVISVTALGFANHKSVCLRSGANEGDLIVVSGDLGASYLGLQLLEREKQVFLENSKMQPELSGHEYLLARHLKPEARLDIIRHFAELGIKPTAMIDVSDGLSSDLMHICKQSNCGALIKEEYLPLDERAFEQALEFNIPPTTCALSGGEDYELLFTINPADESKLKAIVDYNIIGTIKKEKEGALLESRSGKIHNLISLGWDSFKTEQ